MNNMTKVYETQEQFMADVEDGVFSYNGNIELRFILAAPDVNIKTRDIKAGDIEAWNINAGNIDACDIKAGDINACNIVADDIKAQNIEACDINAWNIDASDINYSAVCFAYHNIKCRSIKGRRENAKHFALDGEIKVEVE